MNEIQEIEGLYMESKRGLFFFSDMTGGQRIKSKLNEVFVHIWEKIQYN